jgi:hypothetical protein
MAQLWAGAAALVGATAPDCGSRKGGAFITFSVRGDSAGRGITVGFNEFDAEAGDTMSDVMMESEAQRPQLRGSKRTTSPSTGMGSGTKELYTVTQWVTDGDFIKNAILRARGAVRAKEGSAPPMIPMFNKVVLGTDCDKQWSWHVDPRDVGGWAEVTTEVCDASPKYLEKNGKEWTESPGRWCPWGVAAVLSVEDRRGPRTEMHISKRALLPDKAVALNTTLLDADESSMFAADFDVPAADFDVPAADFNASAAVPLQQIGRP